MYISKQNDICFNIVFVFTHWKDKHMHFIYHLIFILL